MKTQAIIGTLAATAAFATTGCAMDFQKDTMTPEQIADLLAGSRIDV